MTNHQKKAKKNKKKKQQKRHEGPKGFKKRLGLKIETCLFENINKEND